MAGIVNWRHAAHRFVGSAVRQTWARQFSSKGSMMDAIDKSRESHMIIEDILSQPTWSVKSLLPPAVLRAEECSVTPEKLRHLLRLSALPPPKDQVEESKMLRDLADQLHFVQHIQQVNVAAIEPLQAIRDETRRAEAEAELTVEKLKDAFAKEQSTGRHFPRISRRRDIEYKDPNKPDNWHPLKHARRTVRDYYVVDRTNAQTDGS